MHKHSNLFIYYSPLHFPPLLQLLLASPTTATTIHYEFYYSCFQILLEKIMSDCFSNTHASLSLSLSLSNTQHPQLPLSLVFIVNFADFGEGLKREENSSTGDGHFLVSLLSPLRAFLSQKGRSISFLLQTFFHNFYTAMYLCILSF